MHPYTKHIQPIISKALKASSKKLTQACVAERLRISERAYRNLEKGKYCPSTVTFAMLLIQMKDMEVLQLVDELRSQIMTAEEQEAPGTTYEGTGRHYKKRELRERM